MIHLLQVSITVELQLPCMLVTITSELIVFLIELFITLFICHMILLNLLENV